MALQVQAPTRRPRQGGIKTVIEGGAFIPVPRLAVVNQAGGLAWEDSGCGMPQATRAGCYDDVVLAADKTFDGVSQYTTIGDPFARYAGVECYLGGDADRSYVEQAAALLEQGEDRAVEESLWAWAIDGPNVSAVSYVDALGVVEQEADRNYVGAPVILVSRQGAEALFAAGAIVREGGRLVTGNGNWVLATGMVDSTDATTVVAVGAIAVYTSTEVRVSAPQFDENLDAAIAERVYAIGVDCSYRYAAEAPVPAP
jgi:hypothetical protein